MDSRFVRIETIVSCTQGREKPWQSPSSFTRCSTPCAHARSESRLQGVGARRSVFAEAATIAGADSVVTRR